MATLYYSNQFDSLFSQQKILSKFSNFHLQTQKVQKKGTTFLLSTPQGLINDANAISFYLADSSHLLSSDSVTLYSWLQYFNIQINPLLKQLYGQTLGNIQPQQSKYQYSIQELEKNLKIIDDHLKRRTFFAGDSITLVDVVYCCQFQMAFKLLIKESSQKKIPNFVRWFRYVRNTDPFVDELGKMFLCGENEIKVDFEFQIDKIYEVRKEEKKAQEQLQKKEIVIQSEEISNTLQGMYDIDGFKRQFQNFEDKNLALSNLFQKFNEEWSVWKIYYIKYEGEGKVGYQTTNLARGTLQRLEGLRKNGFGKLGVYFCEQKNEFEIRGVMMWKGTEMAKEWKEHPSYQYHQFMKLDIKNLDHQEIIKDYWLDHEKSEGLNFHDSFIMI